MSRDRGAVVLAALVFLVCFAVFLGTACPDVYWYDSGELCAGIALLGLPHSPSFPSFLLLSRPLLFLPLGNLAWRTNLATVLWGSLTVLGIYLVTGALLRGLGLRCARAVAVWTALSTAFQRGIWYQSVKAEVYAFHTLLGLGVLALLWAAAAGRLRRGVPLAALLFGVAAGNHPLLLAHLVPAGALLLWQGRRRGTLQPRALLLALLLVMLGLGVYLYLPIRSARNPFIDLGNPESWPMFWASFTRKSSLNRFLGGSLAAMPGHIARYLATIGGELGYPLLALALVGLLLALRLPLAGPALLLVAAANTFGTMLNANYAANPDTGDGYLMATRIVIGIWTGIGLGALLDLLARRRPRPARLATLAILATLPLYALRGFAGADLGRDDSARRYAHLLLDTMPPSSIVYSGYFGNIYFVFLYESGVARYREDVMHVSRPAIRHWHGTLAMIEAAYPRLRIPDMRPGSPDYQQCLQAAGSPQGAMTRAQRYRFLDRLTLLLVQRNMDRHPSFWFPSQDDPLVLPLLQEHGPLMALRRQSPAVNPSGAIWQRIRRELLGHPHWPRWERLHQQLADDYVNLSVPLLEQGKREAAVRALLRAREIAPDAPGPAQRLRSLGVALD